MEKTLPATTYDGPIRVFSQVMNRPMGRVRRLLKSRGSCPNRPGSTGTLNGRVRLDHVGSCRVGSGRVGSGRVQSIGRVDIPTHPYTTIACAAGVVTRTADRVSLRYRCKWDPKGRAS